MPSLSDLQKRIKSVKNTRQITKAMEVVSATKMRRSQELALNARPYAFAAFELLANASRKLSPKEPLPALLSDNGSKKTLAVVICSDKGLAGSFNANVLRKALSVIASSASGRTKQSSEPGIDLVTIGKKGREFLGYRGYTVVKEFMGHGDYVDITEITGLHDFISEKFLDGTYGKVVCVYTNFLSTLRQEAVVREILPIRKENVLAMIEGLVPKSGLHSEVSSDKYQVTSENGYLFEPSKEKVIQELVDRLFKMVLYHIQLESNASEHSARMVAMKTASDNAKEIVNDLTLEFNKGRQAKITQEIVEITGGAEAVA